LVCGGRTGTYLRAPGKGELRRCFACGFVFAGPEHIQQDPMQLFTAAYSGIEPAGRMYDFRVKMTLKEDVEAIGIHPLKVLTSAHRVAVSILSQQFPPKVLGARHRVRDRPFLDGTPRFGFPGVWCRCSEADS
jgi:hypothetical protein